MWKQAEHFNGLLVFGGTFLICPMVIIAHHLPSSLAHAIGDQGYKHKDKYEKIILIIHKQYK